MFYSDDPIADFGAWDAEQNKRIARLPVCADCDEPIQDDHFYLINGECICPDCMDGNYKKCVEDFIE